MTISEYILENDISFASCDDIEISRCFAEMAVLSSLVESYNKYETICEYTSTNPSEFNIIMESAIGRATEVVDVEYLKKFKDKDVKSNAKSTKEKWYKSIWTWMKKIVTTIMNHFTRIDIKKLIRMLIKLDNKQPDGTIDFPTGKAHDVEQLLDIYEDFLKTMSGERSEDSINKIYERVEALNASDKETVKLTFSEVIAKLDALNTKGVVSRCKVISDNIDKIYRNMSDPDQYFVDDVSRYVAAVKKTTAAISKLYTTNMDAFLETQTRIIKEYKKSNSK